MYLSIYPSTQPSLSHKFYCVSIRFQLDPRNNTNKKYRLFPSQNSQSGYSYSVAQVCLTLCDPMDCSSQASLSFTAFGICSNSCLLGQWCHQTISSSVTPFSSCLQSFPSIRVFSMSQFFASGGQSIGASVSAWVLPMNIQDSSPLGWASWISLQSKGLSRGFSSTTVQKHQFFGTHPSLWSNSHIPLEKP